MYSSQDYNIETELKSLFCTTLNQHTREFILDHAANDLLNQEEQEAYVCYKEIHSAYTRLMEQLPKLSDDNDEDQENEKIDDKAILVQSYGDEKSLERSVILNPEINEGVEDKIDDFSNSRAADIFDENMKKSVENSELKGHFEKKKGLNLTKEVSIHEGESKTNVQLRLSAPDIQRIRFGEFLSYSVEKKMEVIARLYFQSHGKNFFNQF